MDPNASARLVKHNFFNIFFSVFRKAIVCNQQRFVVNNELWIKVRNTHTPFVRFFQPLKRKKQGGAQAPPCPVTLHHLNPSPY